MKVQFVQTEVSHLSDFVICCKHTKIQSIRTQTHPKFIIHKKTSDSFTRMCIDRVADLGKLSKFVIQLRTWCHLDKFLGQKQISWPEMVFSTPNSRRETFPWPFCSYFYWNQPLEMPTRTTKINLFFFLFVNYLAIFFIYRWTIISKYDLSEKLKREFFQTVTV